MSTEQQKQQHKIRLAVARAENGTTTAIPIDANMDEKEAIGLAMYASQNYPEEAVDVSIVQISIPALNFGRLEQMGHKPYPVLQ